MSCSGDFARAGAEHGAELLPIGAGNELARGRARSGRNLVASARAASHDAELCELDARLSDFDSRYRVALRIALARVLEKSRIGAGHASGRASLRVQGETTERGDGDG